MNFDIYNFNVGHQLPYFSNEAYISI